MPVERQEKPKRPTAVGLFAGIGGIEIGLEEAGFSTSLLCEIDPAAKLVLEHQFPDVPLHEDVTTLKELPPADLVAAGFPCQDLSQVGRTAGIGGSQSSLVEHVFRLLDEAKRPPRWLLLENVPFMLSLEAGKAMSYLTGELSARGWKWAYRVVDTRAFGLPHRRLRVILLASREADPRPVLFEKSETPVEQEFEPGAWCGFYWTEGLRGLGWAVEAVPTLKGGSALGIPSAPGVWNSATDEIGTPDLRDAERLQGLPADWTLPAVEDPNRRNNPRWRLVGNAVSTPVARWVGERLRCDVEGWDEEPAPLSGSWPKAAWGDETGTFSVEGVTTWPRSEPYTSLSEFLEYELRPLSHRAAAGFYDRTGKGSLRTFVPGFLPAVKAHVEAMAEPQAA
ncbi:MAG TPA: DNA (cytosine-5-)-methyltransferase [Solirubrobacterales bacterium]|nr:DNA (cytosine-5-)-methyltransferase [Solirubrobacterales bacterium]